MFYFESLIPRESFSEKLMAAKSTETSAEKLEALACDSSPEIRRAVAKNPNTSMIALEILAHDLYPDIRILVGKHPKVTEDSSIRSILNRDNNVFVRLG